MEGKTNRVENFLVTQTLQDMLTTTLELLNFSQNGLPIRWSTKESSQPLEKANP
jgi:hypothetical protein